MTEYPRQKINTHISSQIFPTSVCRKMLMSLSSQTSGDFSLGEDGEALVEPEVLEVLVGDEVSGPAVHDLVGEHIDERLVAGLLKINVIKYWFLLSRMPLNEESM